MEKPTLEQISNSLKEKFGDSILSQTQEYDFPVLVIKKESLFQIVRFLYDDERFQFRYLTTFCGLHYPDSSQPFGIMVQLHSLVHNIRIRFKSFTTLKDLEFDSLTPIFSAVNWMEREAFDFYGIRFKGHPNLKRILNVEDMDYHPMRKEYPVEDATRVDKDDTMFGRKSSGYDREKLMSGKQ
ncbi:MAG: NADH-quinone oxidoreductase subunit C [Bacteroidetes bacterium]|nr:NADH-quinone oxidoreductase subunit C [Bacteroidota bacterium]